MSRSRKKVNYPTINAGTMKFWKRQTNRRYRALCRQALNTSDYDNLVMPVINDSDSFWSSPKDGCFVCWSRYEYWSDYFQEWRPTEKWWRKGFRK